jgi:hypothetical protein
MPYLETGGQDAMFPYGNACLPFQFGKDRKRFPFAPGYLGDFTNAAVGEGPIRPSYDPAELHHGSRGTMQPTVLQRITGIARKRHKWGAKAGLVH